MGLIKDRNTIWIKQLMVFGPLGLLHQLMLEFNKILDRPYILVLVGLRGVLFVRQSVKHQNVHQYAV
jgi:hypothetical protein